jgi:hypothetical protein
MMPETLLPTALLLAERGFSVGPVCRPTTHTSGCSYPGRSHRPHCPDPGKKPIPYAGVKGFTTDAEKLAQWWRWYPSANLGVAMGRASGHFVIESDGPNGLSFLQQWHLPPTPTVISRRGLHKYLKIPPGYTVTTTHLDELDIIGNSDQVVGPGSVHRTGHIYHWHEYLSLEDVAPVEPPAPLISWLIDHRIFSLTMLVSPKYPQVQSRSPKSAARAFSPSDPRPRLTSGEVSDHDGAAVAAAVATGGGYKTSSTNTRCVAVPPETVITELAYKPEIQVHCLTFLRLSDVVENVAHRCKIPGHRERRPSAVLRTGDNGHKVYECLHAQKDELKAYTFPDLYRAQLCGHAILWEDRLYGPKLVPWWERLLIEMGDLSPVPVPHRTIVEDVAPSVHQVYNQYLHLLACRWNYEYGQPTTFSVRFGMEWCGIGSHHTFREALQWLVQHRYIEELWPYTSKITGKVLALYAPGPI